MDRLTVYAGALPLDTDLLTVQKNTLLGLGYLIQATVGTNTICDGLQVTQQTTPDMYVNVAPGSIMQFTTVDTTTFGSEAIDNRPTMKMGVNYYATAISCPAPTTAGYSINYLIEASFEEIDTNAVVLPYYNSANPSQVFSGPSNSGTAQNTNRNERVLLQAKTGTAAVTGTQVTPATDGGYVPLYVVTVAYGQTAITNSNIFLAPGAPFVGTKLGQLRTKLTANMTLYVGSNGSDSNNGVSTTLAFLSIQAAWNYIINNYDLNGYSMTIQVGNGTFAAFSANGTPQGFSYGSSITINGSGSTIIQTTSSSQAAIGAENTQITVSNLELTGAGFGLVANQSSTIAVASGMIFGAQNFDMYAQAGVIIITASYSIVAKTCNGHYYTRLDGSINVNTAGLTVTLTGTPNFGSGTNQGFAVAETGVIDLTIGGVPTYTGAAIGKYFSVSLGGVVNTGTGNTSYLPGNMSGTTGSGTATGYYA